MNHTEPFHFVTERRLVLLTGQKASNLKELLAILRDISGSSIFYHTHHRFLSHHWEKPVVYNDFALWAAEALQEFALAEQLSALDLLAYTSIRQVRDAIIAMITPLLPGLPARPRQCLPGNEFHFCRSRSFVMPTFIVAEDIEDFFSKLGRVSNVSLYFHFLEARLRLGRPTNDFSQWLIWRGAPELAAAVDRLDPYTRTLDELKQEMIDLGRSYGAH
jgi:Family of unknown function (DUF5752)